MKIDEMSRWEGQLLKIRLFLAALRASETDTLDRLEYSVINITKEYGYRV